MLVKTLYFHEFYETVDITTLEKSYKFVTIINRHFYRQLFPSVMWINSTNLRILTITQRVTQRELQYVNKGIYTTLHNFIIKGTFTCTGGVCLLLLEHGLDSPKGNPPKKRSQNSPEFCYTFYDHRGWSTSSLRLYALGVVSCKKSHEPRTVRVTQVRSPKYFRSSHSLRPSTHFVLE